MSELSDFMDRIREVQTHDVPDTQLLDDQRMQQAGAMARPAFERRAERAGIDLTDLEEQAAEMVAGTVRLAMARAVVGNDPASEIVMLAQSCAIQFFFIGVLWEQERHLPNPGPDA